MEHLPEMFVEIKLHVGDRETSLLHLSSQVSN